MGEHDQDAATPPEDVDEEKVVVEGEADDDAPEEGEASESGARTRIAFTG